MISPAKAESAPGFAARAGATRLLSAVLDGHHALDAALDNDAVMAGLDTRDRAFARAAVGMTLRRLGTIDAILARLIEKRPPRAGMLFRILEIAVAQLLFMGVADHAAVSVAVDQVVADMDARHFKALANAVLRRVGRERDALLAATDAPGRDVPAWLWARWSKTYGKAAAAGIADSHHLEPSLDISVKTDPAGWAEKFGGGVLPTGSVRTIPSGPVDAMPGYAEGQWWVQDAAAALPAMVMGDVAGKRVADLCAAPGGKTAALAAAGANVTAIDIAPERLARLAQNMKRLGLTVESIATDILAWKPDEKFDAVLLDAPCTATGTIRRHPDVAYLKREGDIATLAALQARMLTRAVSFLKPGGTLVFCTCSLEPEEGEAHLDHALELGLTPVPIRTEEIGGLDAAITAHGTIRTLPTHLPNATPRLAGLDGFFVMRLKKA